MKQLLFLLFIVFISTSCNKASLAGQKRDFSKDTSGFINNKDLQPFFLKRRESLMGKTGKGIILLRADYGFDGGRHEYRAANNFYYLTGLALSGSMVMLDAGSSARYTLFITEKSVNQEIYTGNMPGSGEMMNSFHADTVLPLEQSDEIIERSIRNGYPVYIDNADSRLREFIMMMVTGIKGDISLVRDISPLIDEMRVIKDSAETEAMQKAVDITGKGFINACRICSPGMYEYDVEAMIEYTYRKNGSPMPAFESIVGSGPNAVTLHYSENARKMESGDLLLMDVGAEYGYYCSDITRTIPVNGKFSKEQKDIYELVLKSQKAAIGLMVHGKYLTEGQITSMKIIIRGLYELGLITDTASEWQRKFYLVHPVSHYLGMDVHDVGDYGVSISETKENIAKDTLFGRLLERGMVITAEPGLYFRSNGLSKAPELFREEASSEEIKDFVDKVTPVYEKYKNIGIRIEDDILITDNGNINLSDNIPKEVGDIEKIMSKKINMENCLSN